MRLFHPVNSGYFKSLKADGSPFYSHINSEKGTNSVVSFPNLRGDAIMIVPAQAEKVAEDAYPHLAAFVRKGPEEQKDNLWRKLGESLTSRLDEVQRKPVWVSTHGGGVSWLHIRLDSRPKYYTYTPFKEPSA